MLDGQIGEPDHTVKKNLPGMPLEMTWLHPNVLADMSFFGDS